MSDSPVKAQVGSDLPVLATPRSFGSNLNTSVSSLGEDGQADVEVTYPDGGWEAWGVAIGGFILQFVSFGLGTNALGVYSTYYHDERPGGPLASRSDISWIGSFQVWASFMAALATGAGLDRAGARRILFAGTLAFVASCMLLSVANNYSAVFVTQGLLQGVAVGALFAPSLACTSQFFKQNRSLALGLVTSGSTMGGVVWPIVLDQLIHHGPGFAWAQRICGFICLALLVVAMILVKTRLPPLEKEPFLDFKAFQRASYSLLLAGQFIIYLGLFFPYFYVPSLGAQNGMPGNTIFYLASAGNGASFFGHFVAGYIGDRLGRFNALIGSLLLSAIVVYAAIATVSIQGSALIGPLYTVASVYGFVSGAFFANQVASLAIICPDPKRTGTWIGMLYAAISLPGLFGPPIGARLIETQGFASGFAFAGSMILGGCLFVIASRLRVDPRFFARV